MGLFDPSIKDSILKNILADLVEAQKALGEVEKNNIASQQFDAEHRGGPTDGTRANKLLEEAEVLLKLKVALERQITNLDNTVLNKKNEAGHFQRTQPHTD